ncbi:MAG: hypothetical protein HY544_04985 [Candidatus Diapherotrites archaeon]|uniref:Uncharacterized protein n=1 Tax=Candidatus Iainarchaeum sp. TaxID=3101447 RepID=A0A8T3YM17_9ARCH|nr:hypothetical protein [Candidatus Diapherotrites archaeon]
MGSEFPESGLVRKTFTIRQMDFPPEVSLTKRSLVRWFALSFGLISEKESRSTILDVLDALFSLQLSKKASPTTSELLSHLRESQKKIDEKLLRYHVKRLIDVGLLERRRGKLSFAVDPHAEKADIVKGFSHNIGIPLHESVSRISLALSKIQEKYAK